MFHRMHQQFAWSLGMSIPFHITVIGAGHPNDRKEENMSPTSMRREHKSQLLGCIFGEQNWPFYENDKPIASFRNHNEYTQILPDKYSLLPTNRNSDQPSLAVNLCRDADAVLVVVDRAWPNSFVIARNELSQLRKNNSKQLVYIVMLENRFDPVSQRPVNNLDDHIKTVNELATTFGATALTGNARPDWNPGLHPLACSFADKIRTTLRQDLNQPFNARESLFTILKDMVTNIFDAFKNIIFIKKTILPSPTTKTIQSTTSLTATTLGARPDPTSFADGSEHTNDQSVASAANSTSETPLTVPALNKANNSASSTPSNSR